MRIKLGRRHGKAVGQLRGEVGLALGGEAVEGPCEGGRPVRGKGELLQSRSRILVEVLECVGGLAGAAGIDCAALVVEHLLHPEAGHRAVEQAEKGQMVCFGGIRRELDDRGSLLEDLAAAVEHEVVVGGDFGEGDGERGTVTVPEEHRVFKPLQSTLLDILTKVSPRA